MKGLPCDRVGGDQVPSTTGSDRACAGSRELLRIRLIWAS
jgi:hypothetical protein